MEDLHTSVDFKKLLKSVFGYPEFRGKQEAIIRNVLEGKNTFVIMPTGAGKSLCYQLPALVKEGTAIVISPLIALMKNQVDQLSALDIEASFLNSTLSKAELKQVRKDVLAGKTRLLYVAPESLTKAENMELLQQSNISFVAIDEAHCISEWGHDFRPEYRRIKSILADLGNLPIVALTATATPKVQMDIQRNLQMEEADVFKSSFHRKNLFYEVRNKKEVNKNLVKFVKSHHRKSGIIYCLSRKKVEEIAELLNLNGVKALPYHAGLDSSVRINNQDAFLNERVDVIVATIAFGMGIDKPDVRFVVHYDSPKSLEGYYQETGRAGRDSLESRCLMFYDEADIEKLDKFNKDKGVKERENARMLLGEMQSFAESALCRQRQILNYFGEQLERDCNFCDNCKRERTWSEVKEEALLVLETVQATEQRFPEEHIIDVILGEETSYTESYSHFKLKQYGKGADKPKAFWQNVFRHLNVYGYLEKDLDNQMNLILSEKGAGYLKQPEALKLYELLDYDKIAENKEQEELQDEMNAQDEGDELLELLFDLRRKVAEEKSLPPYTIFEEGSLREMSSMFPRTETELGQITGVGQGKVRKFGQPFLKLIRDFVEERDIEPPTNFVIKSTSNRSKLKIFIIQQIDRKLDLEEIAEAKGLSMDELYVELENIVTSGTKLHLNYYIDQVVDKEVVEELFDYFYESETGDVEEAIEDLEEDGFTEEEVRLVRLKFMSEVAN